MAAAAAAAATLQQSPVSSFQSKFPPSTKTLPVRLSFSSSFQSLKLTKKFSLAARRNSNRGGGGGAKMMDVAAGSYANAIAEVAKSNGTLEATSADLDKIDQLFSDPQIFKFFINPTIRIEEKRKVLADIATTTSLQTHTANFLNILVDVKRVELIKDIVKEFEVFYNKMTDTELAIVTSVVKLESNHLAQIAKGVQRLTGAKNVRIKTVIDPSLIAGFTIRYGSSASKLIDMSVKKQLDEIASQLDFSDVSLAV